MAAKPRKSRSKALTVTTPVVEAETTEVGSIASMHSMDPEVVAYLEGLPKKDVSGVPWRISHPAQPNYFVAYLTDYGDGTRRESLGLISNTEPPEEALQFSRERDARQFAHNMLDNSIAWKFSQYPAAPPQWSESTPGLLEPGVVPA